MTKLLAVGFALIAVGCSAPTNRVERDLQRCRRVAVACHVERDRDGSLSVYGRAK